MMRKLIFLGKEEEEPFVKFEKVTCQHEKETHPAKC